MKPETLVAIYAAVIGTSAFLLNLKTWLDSGVKLKLSIIPDGVVIGSANPQHDEHDLVILTVINRGDAPTHITNMVLWELGSWWRLWRLRPTKSYVIPNPELRGFPPNMPADLEPGKQWRGLIRRRLDIIADYQTGTFYTGITTTTRNRPYLIRVPKRRKLPEGTKELS